MARPGTGYFNYGANDFPKIFGQRDHMGMNYLFPDGIPEEVKRLQESKKFSLSETRSFENLKPDEKKEGDSKPTAKLHIAANKTSGSHRANMFHGGDARSIFGSTAGNEEARTILRTRPAPYAMPARPATAASQMSIPRS
jgi:hypothetical protein